MCLATFLCMKLGPGRHSELAIANDNAIVIDLAKGSVWLRLTMFSIATVVKHKAKAI